MTRFQSSHLILSIKRPTRANVTSLPTATPTSLELQFFDNKEYNPDVSQWSLYVPRTCYASEKSLGKQCLFRTCQGLTVKAILLINWPWFAWTHNKIKLRNKINVLCPNSCQKDSPFLNHQANFFRVQVPVLSKYVKVQALTVTPDEVFS